MSENDVRGMSLRRESPRERVCLREEITTYRERFAAFPRATHGAGTP
jgi:hypothetical protein